MGCLDNCWRLRLLWLRLQCHEEISSKNFLWMKIVFLFRIRSDHAHFTGSTYYTTDWKPLLCRVKHYFKQGNSIYKKNTSHEQLLSSSQSRHVNKFTVMNISRRKLFCLYVHVQGFFCERKRKDNFIWYSLTVARGILHRDLINRRNLL